MTPDPFGLSPRGLRGRQQVNDLRHGQRPAHGVIGEVAAVVGLEDQRPAIGGEEQSQGHDGHLGDGVLDRPGGVIRLVCGL